MSERILVFIDGASFEGTIKSLYENVYTGFDPYEAIETAHLPVGSNSRVFYFDAPPPRKKNQPDAEHQQLVDQKQRYFDAINGSLNCHVRSCFSRYGGRKRGYEQKGVDVLLAIETLQNAHQGNMDKAFIYTSDLDFIPVFDALAQTRVTTHLFFDPRACSLELQHSADQANPITTNKAVEWLKEPYRDKLRMYNIASPKKSVRGHPVFEGKVEGTNFIGYEWENVVSFVPQPERQSDIIFRGGSVFAITDSLKHDAEFRAQLQTWQSKRK